MDHSPSDLLLVEAAMLITATRLRIARSMTLLAKVALDGVCAPRAVSAGALGARAGSGPPRTSPPPP